jgi:glucokinase
MIKRYIVGIDLGGTKISGAIANQKGEILHCMRVKTLAYEGVNAILDRIKMIIQALIDHVGISYGDIIGIGIGSPGPLDSKKGIVINSPNLPGFNNVPVVSIIENEFNVNTYLDNDANAAALGELLFGAGRGCNNFIYITVSTGIGCGIVVNGEIYYGKSGNAGEIGDTVIATLLKDSEIAHRTLEELASGTAIAKIAREKIASGRESILKNYQDITSKEVFKAAGKRDKLALEVLDFCFSYLGIGIANAITLFDPEKVIIGGGVSKGGPIFFDKVKEKVSRLCFKVRSNEVEIVPAGLNSHSGVIGAIGIVLINVKK